MKPKLVALHGYTLNGALTRQSGKAIFAAIEDHVDIACLDAPHTCSADSVQRAYAAWRTSPLPGPYHTWWRASDDGRTYEGWQATCDVVRKALPANAPVGLLGFSQGAMVAATLAALSVRDLFPPLAFVVLIAGRLPRADVLQPLFDAPITIPSLHVWGERDSLASQNAPELMEHFDPRTRRQISWRGSHVIPPGGLAAQGIADFIREHCLGAERDQRSVTDRRAPPA